ncbi:DNA polymerase alpha catalytic subunit-like isoform X2 [Prorops nasuta]|uniref:DNA polymerase alpha catalytic subunit-like isoform X2 n=1 Tax=Prorops nasuta TaxID=863751 RepID=UPI0034CD7EBD
MAEEFMFFWWDAYEDPKRLPGTAYFFGKTYVKKEGKFSSCCLIIENIPRQIYVIPKNSMEEAKLEFDKLAETLKIQEYKWHAVTKYWIFEKGSNVQNKVKCAEVTYPAKYSTIDCKYSGNEIQNIVGSTVNALEVLLINRNLKSGPCWLKVMEVSFLDNRQDAPSWCRVNVFCNNFENIHILSNRKDIPFLTCATLNIRIAFNNTTKENKAVMAVIKLNTRFNLKPVQYKNNFLFEKCICLVTIPNGFKDQENVLKVLPKQKNIILKYCKSEQELLAIFIETIDDCDPDIFIVNDAKFQLGHLLNKLNRLNIMDSSKISRIKYKLLPKTYLLQCIPGRPLWDILEAIGQLNLKVDHLDIFSISKELEIEDNCESLYKKIEPFECLEYYKSAEKIEFLLNTTIRETTLILSIALKLTIIPITHFVTCISGNIVSKAASRFLIDQVEYLLLHAFYERDYILPDKEYEFFNKLRKSYQGALVLEPKPGFYENIVLYMDFTSMYPSIIQEYNLCFSTMPDIMFTDVKGVIPQIMQELMQHRVSINKQLTKPSTSLSNQMMLQSQEKALKLIMNSVYGCIGSKQFRFACNTLAATIADLGRKVLMTTKGQVEKLNYDIIYGDTDCLMIDTKLKIYEKALAIKSDIQEKINSFYKVLRFELATVFRFFLLVKKKNYAGLSMKQLTDNKIEFKLDVKGIEMIKRSTCSIVRNVGRDILNVLFSDNDICIRFMKIYAIIDQAKQTIYDSKDNISIFVISKKLSKNPSQYTSTIPLHVLVAQRLNEEGGRLWTRGDIVPHVLCKNVINLKLFQRAYHPNEVKKDSNLYIDIDYYINYQLNTVVSEFCNVIKGINKTRIKEAFAQMGRKRLKKGFYPSNYNKYFGKITENVNDKNINAMLSQLKPVKLEPFVFICQNQECKAVITIDNVTSELGLLALESCPNPRCKLAPWQYSMIIKNFLLNIIKKLIITYYTKPLKCINPLCSIESKIEYPPRAKFIECIKCEEGIVERQYEEDSLFNQLDFYRCIFDIDQEKYKDLIAEKPIELINVYRQIKEFMDNYLKKKSSFGVFGLSSKMSHLDKNKIDEKIDQYIQAVESLPDIKDIPNVKDALGIENVPSRKEVTKKHAKSCLKDKADKLDEFNDTSSSEELNEMDDAEESSGCDCSQISTDSIDLELYVPFSETNDLGRKEHDVYMD